MSKEAMQAVAIFATSGAKRKNGKPIPASWLNCLIWMAYYSRDTETPYHAKISQKTLAGLCQLQDTAAVRKVLRGLESLGILGRSEKDGRENTYTIELGSPDPVSYTAIFAPPQYRSQETSNGSENRSQETSNGSENRSQETGIEQIIEVPQYPYQVQSRSHGTSALAPIEVPQNHNTGPTEPNRGPTGSLLPIREKYEKREENDTRVRVREEHEDEPHSSAEIWNQIINHVTENREDLNGYSADLAEIERWKRLFRHEAPAYMRLKLRGPADLAKSPRVKAMIYAAASRLYDARMVVEFQWW